MYQICLPETNRRRNIMKLFEKDLLNEYMENVTILTYMDIYSQNTASTYKSNKSDRKEHYGDQKHIKESR